MRPVPMIKTSVGGPQTQEFIFSMEEAKPVTDRSLEFQDPDGEQEDQEHADGRDVTDEDLEGLLVEGVLELMGADGDLVERGADAPLPAHEDADQKSPHGQEHVGGEIV